MTGKLKIIILALVALLVISLFLIFGIQGSKSRLLREYNQTRERLTRENKELASRLESISAENRGLQERLTVVQQELEHISSDKYQLEQKYEVVSKERQELLAQAGSYGQLKEDLELFENENQLLKEQIATLEKEKLSLETKLKEAKQDKEGFKQKIAKAKEILKKKPSMAGYVREQELSVTQEAGVWSVDLPPIVVSPQVSSEVDSSSSLAGKILNANTDYAFVVIDLGQQMGVRKGMVFDVFRRNKFLGRIEVIQLRKKIAACDIVQADTLFKPGDTVRY